MWYIHKKGEEYVTTRDKPKKPYIELEKHPIIPVEDGCIPILKADFKTGAYWYEQHENEEHRKRVEIGELKQVLADTDYKVIKQAEAQFAGAELPYSAEQMEQTHAYRQELRDRIDELLPQLEAEREESEG